MQGETRQTQTGTSRAREGQQRLSSDSHDTTVLVPRRGIDYDFDRTNYGERVPPDEEAAEVADAYLGELVLDRLADDPWLDASDIKVEVSSHEVVLGGTVTSRQAVIRAVDIACSVPGISEVLSELRVVETH